MVLNEIWFRKPATGRITYFNPADVDASARRARQRTGACCGPTASRSSIGGIDTMSKSKNNGVDPQALVDRFGADTVRLFTMFAAPPEQTLEWSDEGVEGAFRFLKRLWKLVHAHVARPAPPAGPTRRRSTPRRGRCAARCTKPDRRSATTSGAAACSTPRSPR